MQGGKDSRKSKQRNKCRKNNNRFKKLKIKIKNRKETKQNSTELQKPNVEAEVYNNTKKCDWEKKEKPKSLIRFHSANKIDNYNWERGVGGRKKKKKKIQKKLQNKSKHKNNKSFSWATAIRVLFLSGSQSTSPPEDALQHCVHLRTCCGGSSDSNLVLLLSVLASNVHRYQN